MDKRELELLLCVFFGWAGGHKFYKKKIFSGILYLLTFGLFGIGWIIDIILLISRLIKKDTSKDFYEVAAKNRIERENLRKAEIERKKLEEPEEYKRKADLCSTIYAEYESLLSTLRDTDDILEKGEILKECYRKLDVINTTHYNNDCFRDVDDDIEKIEKKAQSILSSYITQQRKDGAENDEIDILQFEYEFDFISDWIYEKDEQLNR